MSYEFDPEIGSQAWQEEANCLGADPDLFFPERGASTREAKEVCRGCPVRLDCLEYSLVNNEKFGIWGGLSERERRRLRRQRAQSRRLAAPAIATALTGASLLGIVSHITDGVSPEISNQWEDGTYDTAEQS